MALRGPLSFASALFLPLSFGLALVTALAAKADPQVAMIPTLASTSLTDTGPENDLVPSPLGMRLSTFKQMPAIDRGKYPNARVLCSGDPELRNSTSMAVMRPMPDEQQAGVIRCNAFRPDPVNLSWWAPILPKIEGKQAKSVNYFFLPESNGDYRLLFVQAVLPDDLLPAAREQLTAQLGTPKKRNEPGLVSESLWTESWQTPDTWLLLDSRKGSFRHDFTLTYVSADLVDDAAARGFDEKRYPLYYSAYNHYR
ncbi:MAG TPA: hypothetical protein VM639_24060 [Dongiaceae bacterium]|nr:hypothetical protein [Dongiaceae bacterium]